MAISEFNAALKQICSERGLSEASVIATIEEAVIAAYRRDYGGELEDLTAKVDSISGEMRVFDKGKEVTLGAFGRIAAQTAKQVILQKIRESEKEALLAEYSSKIGTIAAGHVFRVEKGLIIFNLGKIQGVMPQSEQIPGENYSLNTRMRVYLKEAREGTHGPEVLVSRADPDFVKALFALEVPEINAGTVKVAAIAREPGSRTKIAVSSTESNVDPVGSCVGQKGTRVQAVIAEIGNEKIDIVNFNSSSDKFIAAALAPAKVVDVILNESVKEAKVLVPEDQLSLAIGKEGQNVRLAAKLTGFRIDIKTPATANEPAGGSHKQVEGFGGLSSRTAKALEEVGITSIEDLKAKTIEEIKEIKGIGPKALDEVKSLMQ